MSEVLGRVCRDVELRSAMAGQGVVRGVQRLCSYVGEA